MSITRKDCPQHTTGGGPCYCQYNKDTDNVYHAPDDIKPIMSALYKVLRGKSEVSPLIACRIRQVNTEFIRSRMPGLSGANLARAVETLKNLQA